MRRIDGIVTFRSGVRVVTGKTESEVDLVYMPQLSVFTAVAVGTIFKEGCCWMSSFSSSIRNTKNWQIFGILLALYLGPAIVSYIFFGEAVASSLSQEEVPAMFVAFFLPVINWLFVGVGVVMNFYAHATGEYTPGLALVALFKFVVFGVMAVVVLPFICQFIGSLVARICPWCGCCPNWVTSIRSSSRSFNSTKDETHTTRFYDTDGNSRGYSESTVSVPYIETVQSNYKDFECWHCGRMWTTDTF